MHWLWCYIFVRHLGLNLIGIAYAGSITSFTGATLLYLYVIIKNPRPKSWFWFNNESFKGLFDLLKANIQIGAMVYLDWIAYEITMIIAVTYSPEQMGAHITVYNIMKIILYVPVGLGLTLNTFTGNSIGEKNINKTKAFFFSGLIINSIYVLFGGIFIYLFREPVVHFFSIDKTINQIAEKICLLYIVLLPADSFQVILSAYVRAIGKERLGSLGFVVSFYLIGLPIAFLLGSIYEYTVEGLWIGLGVAMYCMLIWNILLIASTTLNVQAQIIERRLHILKREE